MGKYRKMTIKMTYEVIILGHLHMPLYFIGTFTEYSLLYNRITLPHRLLRSSTGATTNSESCDFVLSSLLFSFDATNIEMIFFKFQIIMDFYSNGYILFVLILFRIGIDVLPFSLIPGKILASLFLFSRFLLLS